MQYFNFWSYFSVAMLPAVIACILGSAATIRIYGARGETGGRGGLMANTLVCGGSTSLALWTASLALPKVGVLDVRLVSAALLVALVGSWYGLAITRFKTIPFAAEAGGAAIGITMSTVAYLAILAHHRGHGVDCHGKFLVIGVPVITACAALAFGQIKRRNSYYWTRTATVFLAVAFLVMSWAFYLGCTIPATAAHPLELNVKMLLPSALHS